MANDDPLPVPAQLETQLGKCKTMRDAATHYKSRVRSAAEIKATRAKLPPPPVPSK